MNQARIVLQPPLSSPVDGTVGEILVSADTVTDALRAACERYPRLRPQLFDDESISPFVHVFVNGNQVSKDLCGGRQVTSTDEIFVLTAIRGG